MAYSTSIGSPYAQGAMMGRPSTSRRSAVKKKRSKKPKRLSFKEDQLAWFKASGQSGKAGSEVTFKKKLDTSGMPPNMAAGYLNYRKRMGQGDYNYSTFRLPDNMNFSQYMDAQSAIWKKRKKSGGKLGGIAGVAFSMGKTALRNPKYAVTGVDPISTKMWSQVTGQDIKPLTTQMGGPSMKSYEDYTKNTGKTAGKTTRGFFKMADMVAGIIGGGAGAAALAPAAAGAAGGAGTLMGDIAAGAAGGAVKGFAGVTGTGTEDVSAMGKGALAGGITGAFKGGYSNIMDGSGSATTAAASTGGKDMSLWDTVSDYYTDESGGANWGNILGTAGKALSIYGQYQGAQAQKDAARQAAGVAQEQYGISKDMSQRQFGLAEKTLDLRIAQMAGVTKERGAIRSEMRGNLSRDLSDLGQGYRRSRGYLEPLMGEADLARQQQMGLLGLGGYKADLAKTPGYQFRMEESMRGAERGLASTGGSRSGRAAIELQQRAGGLAGQYFDTHLGQLGQFAQAGTVARSQLSNLSTQYGQGLAGQRLGYSQLQSGLVPRADMFNSQFGQMDPNMGSQYAGALGTQGAAQSNMYNMIGGGMSLLGSFTGGQAQQSTGGGGTFNEAYFDPNQFQNQFAGSYGGGY